MGIDDQIKKALSDILNSINQLKGEVNELKQKSADRDQLAELEQRLAALEKHTGIEAQEPTAPETAPSIGIPPSKEPEISEPRPGQEPIVGPEPPPEEPPAPAEIGIPDKGAEEAPPPGEVPPLGGSYPEVESGEKEEPRPSEPAVPDDPSQPDMPAAPKGLEEKPPPPDDKTHEPTVPPELPPVSIPPPPEVPPPPKVPAPPPPPSKVVRPAAPAAPKKPAVPRPPPPPPPPKKDMDWGEIEAKIWPWFTRLGVGLAVLGGAWALSYAWEWLSLPFKVATVYSGALAMGGVGWFFEKKERYSTWGKIMIAGGWAGVYITTFMIHYLEEARLIKDPTLDVFLMMVIALGMIGHSFKYRSQSLTTLTYFIAFGTIALSLQLGANTLFSLVGTTVLAVSMLFILYRMQWYWLAFFSLAACYGTHALWIRLTPMFEELRLASGPVFKLGVVLIVLYWLTFTVAVFLTRPKDKQDESLSLWMMAMNYVLFIIVFRYHVGSEHPEWRWYFTSAVAAAYIVLTYIAHNMRRENLYTLSLVIAVLSTTLTLYFKLLGGNWVAVGWLLQAEALYVAGLLADEKRFRWIGVANFVLVGVWMIAKDFFMVDELTLWGLTFYKRTLIFATAAVVFYINAAARHIMAHRIKREETFSFLFSYSASILWLIIMVRNWVPHDFLVAAVAGAALALILMEVGIRTDDLHFRVQGMAFAFLAVLSALVPLAGADSLYYTEGFYYRIASEVVVILIAYIVFSRFQKQVLSRDEERHIEVAAAVFSGVVAVAAVLMLYREIEPSYPFWLSLAFMIFGVILIEIGIALRNPFLRVQGYLVTALTLLWAIYAFFAKPGWMDHPFINFMVAGIVVAFFFYLFARILTDAKNKSSRLAETERTEAWSGAGPVLAVVFSVAGSLLLLLLLRQELIQVSPMFIAVAWLAVAIGLFETGIAISNGPLRLQGLIIAGLAFVYALVHNLVEGSYLGPISLRLITILLCAGAIYYICERLFRGDQAGSRWADVPVAGPALSWAAAVLIILVIQREVWVRWPAWVGVAWVVPMAVFYLVGLKRRSVNFLLQGLAASTAIFFWTLFVTIPAVGTSDLAERIASHRIFAAAPIIAVFYGMFALAFMRKDALAKLGEDQVQYAELARDTFSWAGSILLVALVTVEVNDVSRALTTAVWAGLCILFFETGKGIKNQAFKSQAYLLAAATFGRALVIVLPSSYGEFLFMSGRTAAMLVVAASLYYLYLRLFQSDEETQIRITESTLGSVLSYMALLVLSLLIFKEVRPDEYVPAAWAGLLLAAMIAGMVLRDRHLMIQAMILVVPVVFGALIMAFPEHGTTPARVSVGLAVGALFAARVLWQVARQKFPELFTSDGEEVPFLAGTSKHIFSIPAAALLAIYIPIEFRGGLAKYMTLAWACEGLLVMVLGFALKDRILRFVGIGILAVCTVKVFWDLWRLKIGRQYKVMALIGLGAILILIGFIYARFSEQIKKILNE